MSDARAASTLERGPVVPPEPADKAPHGLVDAGDEQDFDDLARLAASCCATPMALITILDDSREWFKSRVGLDRAELPLEHALARSLDHAFGTIAIADTLADARLATHPLVTGEPFARFIAGVPLLLEDGTLVGSLCVLDRAPRELDSHRAAQLAALGRQVLAQVRVRSQARALAAEIASRRAFEESLETAEERNRSTFDFAPVGLAVLQLDGTLDQVNPAFCEFLGTSEAASIGANELDFTHVDDRHLGLDEVQEVIAGERRASFLEKRYVRADGAIVWGARNISAVRDSAGRAIFLVAQIKDTTERRTREDELRRVSDELAATNAMLSAAVESARASRALYQELVAQLPDTIAIVCDRERRITVAGGGGIEAQGLDPADLVGNRIGTLLHPLDAQALDALLDRALAGERCSVETRLITVSIEARVDAVPLVYTPGSDPDGAILVVRNIDRYREREARAEAAEAQWRAVFDDGPVGMVEVGLDDVIVCANKAMGELLGMAPEAVVGTRLHDHLAPTDPEELVRRSAALAQGSTDRETVEYRILTADGTKRWAALRATVLAGGRSGPTRVLVHVTETTDEHESWAKLEATHARFFALVEHSSDGIVITEASGEIAYASPGTAELTGVEPDALLGTHLWSFCHPDDLSRVNVALGEVLSSVDTVMFECRLARGSEWRHIEFTATNRLADPAVAGIVFNGRDVTERVDAANRLTHQATHDALTGLPNRALLLERLADAIALGRRSAVLYVDLDHFKTVNDALGHGAGDELLVAVAQRLRHVVRPGDTVARIGGDEFVILAGDIRSEAAAIAIAERTCAALREPIALSLQSVRIGCSVGIALSKGHSSTAVLQEADAALYLAKHAGRNRWATCPVPTADLLSGDATRP